MNYGSLNNPNGPDATAHAALKQGECLACHASNAGILGAGAADFRVAAISTDLRDDHPVGVKYPSVNGDGTDWKTPGGSATGAKFFDDDADNRMDKGEIRLYGSGADASVECGSCHDPHGVTNGSLFNATFLRKPRATVCLSCHTK